MQTGKLGSVNKCMFGNILFLIRMLLVIPYWAYRKWTFKRKFSTSTFSYAFI